jgi:hypothetical protein
MTDQTPAPTPPPSLGSFWKDHGTKVLGYIGVVLSGLAAGSVVLPPPLNTYSSTITGWAVFLNFLLSAAVVIRGQGNTTAIAAQVTANQAAVVAGNPPPLPPAKPSEFVKP